jgi:hypothetical protein
VGKWVIGKLWLTWCRTGSEQNSSSSEVAELLDESGYDEKRLPKYSIWLHLILCVLVGQHSFFPNRFVLLALVRLGWRGRVQRQGFRQRCSAAL